MVLFDSVPMPNVRAAIHGRRHVVDLRQRENDAVVVHREVENRIGHLLVGDSASEHRVPQDTNAVRSYRQRSKDNKPLELFPPALGIAGQTAVKRLWAHAQYAVCAQQLPACLRSSPRLSDRYLVYRSWDSRLSELEVEVAVSPPTIIFAWRHGSP